MIGFGSICRLLDLIYTVVGVHCAAAAAAAGSAAAAAAASGGSAGKLPDLHSFHAMLCAIRGGLLIFA